VVTSKLQPPPEMIACEKVTVKINAQCLLSRISETITLSFWVCLPFVSSHAHYAQARPPATGDRHLSAEIANATEGPVHNNLLNDAEGPDAEGPVHNNLLSDAEGPNAEGPVHKVMQKVLMQKALYTTTYSVMQKVLMQKALYTTTYSVMQNIGHLVFLLWWTNFAVLGA